MGGGRRPSREMPIPPITLCRVRSRLDFRPKSLAYFGQRANFASRYFPKLYSDWHIKAAELRLSDNATEKRMVLTSGSIGFEVDGGLENLQPLTSHMAACMQGYVDEIIGDSKLVRLGLAMSFLTENSSFDELFPIFNANTLSSVPWCDIKGYTVRDIGFANIYYGTEKNGLNLQIGVLTAEQAVAFRDELGFDRKRQFADIGAGGLLLGLDRYTTEIRGHKTIEEFLGDHNKLRGIAHELAASTLQGVQR